MTELSGRVCVVTGASSGIGRATAEGLARRGGTVAVVGRNPERTAAVSEELRALGAGRAEAFVADFSRLSDVRRVASELGAAFPEIHLLINNAGLIHPHRVESADGYEDTFAVNHLAPFALTRALLPQLSRAASARIVTVSSRLHTRPKSFRFDDWQWTARRYSPLGAYAQSKLANVMFANELARRVAEHGVTSNSVHPGDVATNVVREHRFLQWGLDHIARFFLKSPADGARTSLYVATAPELGGVTGRYFRDSREARCAPAALDRDACARLWDLSEALTA